MNENKSNVLIVVILLVVIAGQVASYVAVQGILEIVLTDRPTQIIVTVSGNDAQAEAVETETQTGQIGAIESEVVEIPTEEIQAEYGANTSEIQTIENKEDFVWFRGRWIPVGTLTRSGGVNGFEGHGETYYNLDMSGVISNAADHGITGEVWINESGCKMLGDYIMCAAHPSKYGQVIGTSLGLGIVVDTGDFYYTEPEQVDIAVNW